MSSSRATAVCILIAGLANATPVRAGGFYVKEQSAEGVGRAFAGSTAFAPDASAVYFNPAALTTLEGPMATAGVANAYGLILEAEQENLGTVRGGPGLIGAVPVEGGNGGNPFDPLIPVFNVYFAMPADDEGLWVGLGVNSPFGLNDKYDGDFFGRYDALKSLLFTLNIQPTVAYSISPNVSMGAGLDIQYAEITLTNALPNLDPALDGFFRAEADDWALGWNFGIHADLGALQLGAHFRSGINHTLEGKITIRGLVEPLAVLNGGAGAVAPLDLPDIVSGGLVYDIPETRVRIMWDFTWFNWSDFEAVRIVTLPGDVFEKPQNYRDTWSFALGGEFDWSEHFTVRAGSQYDETPTRNAFRDTRVPDGDRWWAAVGATWRISPQFSVALSYAHVFVSTERIDLVESFFEGTPAQIDVRTVSENSGNADIIALGVSARF